MNHFLISVLLSFSVLLFVAPAPQHEKPTEYCHPSHNAVVLCGNGKGTCLTGHGKDGCKDGDRMEETNLCSSYCWKEMCKCCQVLHKTP